MKKRVIAVLLMGVLILGLIGCAQKPETKIASVNDTSITRGQLDQLVSLFAYINSYDPAQMTNEYKQSMLQDMVDMEAAKQYYIANGATLPETYETDKAAFLEEAHTNAGEALTESGITDEFLSYYYELQNYAGLLMDEISKEMETEEFTKEAQAYYDAHQSEYTQQKQVSASHILVETEEEANDILAKINAGEDFAELAKTYSKDGSAANGGELGYFSEGQMVTEFNDAAFALKPGEVSGIVKTTYGYHIIKCNDVKEGGGVSPYEEVQSKIYETLYYQKLENKIGEIEKGMDIEVDTVK